MYIPVWQPEWNGTGDIVVYSNYHKYWLDRERKIKNNTKKQIIEGKINSLKKENTNKVNLQNTQMQHRENNSFKQEIKEETKSIFSKENGKKFKKYFFWFILLLFYWWHYY